MLRAVLFGAGQYGKVLCELLDRKKYTVIGFLDNHLSGSAVCGFPVYHPDNLPEIGADCVMLALKGDDRRADARKQIEPFGVPVILPPLDQIDLRAALTRRLSRQIRNRNIIGCVAELGVYQGEFAALLNGLFPERRLYLFDTFCGFPPEDICREKDGASPPIDEFKDTQISTVLERLPYPENAVIIEGRFPGSAANIDAGFAFVSLDADLYLPTYEGLRWFYPRLNPGGVILVHDAESGRFPGAGKALRQFCEEERVFPVPLCDLHGSALVTRSL